MSTPYDYHLLTPLPILPRRRLGDENIDSWVERDEQIETIQWELLEVKLSDMTELENYHWICMHWSLDYADNEDIDDERESGDNSYLSI